MLLALKKHINSFTSRNGLNLKFALLLPLLAILKNRRVGIFHLGILRGYLSSMQQFIICLLLIHQPKSVQRKAASKNKAAGGLIG